MWQITALITYDCTNKLHLQTVNMQTSSGLQATKLENLQRSFEIQYKISTHDYTASLCI
jgi:hypothetical protein